MDSFLKIFKSQLFSKVLYVGMSLCPRLKTGICDIYFTQNLFLFYVNSVWYDYGWNNNLIMLCSYVKENTFYTSKLCFFYWATFWWSVQQILSKLFQCCFLNVEATPMNKFNFHFQPNIKVETTLIHRRWINVILSMLFQRCFINVETMSINIRRLNFHFQPSFNVEATFFLSTLNWRNSIDVVSTLFCQRWNNIGKCTLAQLSFSTKYQRGNNVDERWQSTLFQRWINVDVFAGMFKNKLLEFSINTNWTKLIFFDNASFHVLLIHS